MLVVTTAVSRAQNSLYPLGKFEFIVLLSFFSQNTRITLANWRQKCQKWKVITLLSKTFISSYTIVDNSNGVLFLASLLHFMMIFFKLKQEKSS